MSKKYIEVPKKDEAREKAKKKISVLLLLSVFCVSLGFIMTACVFVSPYFAFGAMVFEILSPVGILMAFKTTVEYKNGKAGLPKR